MLLIVGLGNPGKKYELTRHNAGFIFLDKFVCNPEIAPVGDCVNFSYNEKFEADIAETSHKGEKIILAKPQTFMNLSGKAVRKILDFYKLDTSDLIVVCDDKDLPLGTVRIRRDGSSAGQKGLQNIIETLGTEKFLRIRIGINAIGGDSRLTTIDTDKIDTADFVLGKFDKRELPILDDILLDTAVYVLPFIGSKTEIPPHTLEVKFDSL